MSAFADFIPLLIFLIVYQITKDIFLATGLLIIATTAQVAFFWLKDRTVKKMHLITLAMVLIFGGLTVALKDDTFIKWKPSVINWLFALAFLASEFFMEKSFIRRMLDENVSLSPKNWRLLNYSWIGFFLFCSFLNLYVAYSFSQESWVNFKVFGLLGLTLVFVVMQGIWISRHMQEESSAENPRTDSSKETVTLEKSTATSNSYRETSQE